MLNICFVIVELFSNFVIRRLINVIIGIMVFFKICLIIICVVDNFFV